MATHPVTNRSSYGISNHRRAFWSIANACGVIGHAPEDDSEVRYYADIASLRIGSPGRPGKIAP